MLLVFILGFEGSSVHSSQMTTAHLERACPNRVSVYVLIRVYRYISMCILPRAAAPFDDWG